MKKIHIVLAACLFMANVSTGQNIGYSGMVKTGKSKYLVVTDNKHHEKGSRLLQVKVSENGFSHKKLDVKDWKHKDGRSNDLEAVCAVPGAADEYLLMESGYWNKAYGRIFRISLKDDKVKVLDVYKLPKISPAGKENPMGDNFEGVACIAHEKDLYILLGERGGTARYNNGLLRIGVLRDKEDKIDWDTYADQVFEAKLPRSYSKPPEMRTISDLYLDPKGILFAAAAVDTGDIGPFQSVIYEVGSISFKNGKLQITRSKNKEVYQIDGFKVEALSVSPPFMSNTHFCVGTEDENLGGEWRALIEE